MEVEVLSKEENKLLGRVEVRFRVVHSEGTTPPREAVKDALISALKIKDKTVVIDHLKSQFGKRESKGYAKVYQSLEDASKIERKYTLLRNKLVSEEAPKEETKEQAKERAHEKSGEAEE